MTHAAAVWPAAFLREGAPCGLLERKSLKDS